MELADEQGMPHWAAQGRVNLGWALVGRGRADEGIEYIQAGMSGLAAIGTRAAFTYFEGALAEAELRRGRVAAALAALDRALGFARATDEQYYLPELHRLRGEALLASGDRRGAAGAFADARELATQQGAGAFVHRAEHELEALTRAAIQ
jgi:predicted ATPase